MAVEGLGLRVLHVTGYGVKIGASRGALLVEEKGGSRSLVPLSDVDVVVVGSSGVSVTSSAMRLMLRSGVELVVVDHRGDPVGMLWGMHPTRTPETRRQQYQAAADGRGARIAGWIARRKLEAQSCTLKRLAHLAEDPGLLLDEAARLAEEAAEALEWASRAGSLEEARRRAMQVEARAARRYWAAIASVLPRELGFAGRDKEGGDPFNAALNYGYGILYALAWRAAVLAGLDPYAGFLHADRSGSPTLTFDLVELFRSPAVDEPLAREAIRGWRPTLEADGRLSHQSRMEAARLVVGRLNRGGWGRGRLEEAVRRAALSLARSLRSGGEWAPEPPCREVAPW